MKKAHRFCLIVIVLLSTAGCDQLTKRAARGELAPSGSISLLGDVVRFEYAENRGAFLSIGEDLPSPVFLLFSLSLTAVVLFLLLRLGVRNRAPRPATLAGLSLLAGGSAGNLVDRLLNGGAVVDFVSLGVGSLRTGVFNVADLAILTGAILLPWSMRDEAVDTDAAQPADRAGRPPRGAGRPLTGARPSEVNTEKVRNDFDEIARLAREGESGTERYDRFLLSQVPARAVDVLEVGCGLGRLTAELATGERRVVGMDVSPEMIGRARQGAAGRRVSFVCGDFLEHDFGAQEFDCVISAATLHHMREDLAVARMAALLRPGGRLVIHDLRRDTSLLEHFRTYVGFSQVAFVRLIRTGRPRKPRAVREAWERHGAGETYLTLQEAQALAARLLPGARVISHWLCRYTIVWDKAAAA